MEIEEIARQNSIKDLGKESLPYQAGFTQGVRYQRNIDIEKFKRWLSDNPGITFLEENRTTLSKLLESITEGAWSGDYKEK